MHYDAGLDVSQQALADQLALEGFIAVALICFPDAVPRAETSMPSHFLTTRYEPI